MIHREVPICPVCGNPLAKAKYKDQSGTPQFMRVIGDDFIGWENINHPNCKPKDWTKDLPDNFSDENFLGDEFNNNETKRPK